MKQLKIPYRYKKIKDKYLITNEYFNWLYLTEEEFKDLKEDKIKKDSEFYKKLVKNRFIFTDPEKIEEFAERERDHLNSLFFGPSLHIVVLTKRCPQACIYCHAAATTNLDKEKYDLSKENAKKYVDLIMNSPNPSITIEFQGGEPLLNFDILKYMSEYARELNKKLNKHLVITVVTNLELMEDQKFNYLINNDIKICTSLDGPKKLHDKNRPSSKIKSSYDKTVEWISKGKEKGMLFGALVTVSKESLKYPIDIIDEYAKLNMRTIHLRPLNFLGNAIHTWNQIGYTPDEFIDFWKKAINHVIDINKKGIFMIERTCSIMLQKILNQHEPQFLDLMSPCGAVIGQMSYDYDGKIYSCDEARTLNEDFFQVGDSNSKSVGEIVKDQKSIEIISTTINDQYYCNYCVYKPYCGVCPVCNYKETGNPICDVLSTSRCKILMAQFDYLFEKLQDPEIKKVFESWVKSENSKPGDAI